MTCFKCFREDENDVRLLKCASCRRVAYCGTGCQKADWATHKRFCKAFKAMGLDSGLQSSNFALANNLAELNRQTMQRILGDIFMLEKALGRNVNVLERNLISMQPRCIACSETDRSMLSAPMSSSGSSRSLFPCPDCKLTFFCSAEHEKAAYAAHRELPCDEGHDNLTQCQLNQELRSDINFSNVVALDGPFVLAPQRTKLSWIPLRGSQGTSVNSNWNDEFTEDLATTAGVPPTVSLAPLIRAASETLSMPMTILWALQNLKTSDHWTRQDTLTIHVLGPAEKEIMGAQVFEEILHRLPEVKTLKLVFCGPELSQLFSRTHESVMELDTCPACRREGRKRLHQHYSETYHELAWRPGNKLSKPDLAIAFNSGASEEGFTWVPTMRYLVNNKINSLFTSFNREEAEGESRILKDMAGATLLIDARINPWGSAKLLQEQTKVLGYYSVNRWIAGGF